MPIFKSTIYQCYQQAIVRVDGVRLSASCRLVDNGMQATIYANDLNVIMYMMRNMIAESYHAVEGLMSIRYVRQSYFCKSNVLIAGLASQY
jgi:hypothetical protein